MAKISSIRDAWSQQCVIHVRDRIVASANFQPFTLVSFVLRLLRPLLLLTSLLSSTFRNAGFDCILTRRKIAW